VIYFAMPVAGGPIKIGFSCDVDRRLAQLEDHHGLPFVLLTTMDGDRKEETEIHERFAHLRLGKTEQFRPRADLLAFIGQPSLVVANPDTVEVIPPRQLDIKTLFSMKGDVLWFEWLKEFAEFQGRTATTTIDIAVQELAKKEGFSKPMPKRMPPKR
jgi:hypothetical protein